MLLAVPVVVMSTLRRCSCCGDGGVRWLLRVDDLGVVRRCDCCREDGPGDGDSRRWDDVNRWPKFVLRRRSWTSERRYLRRADRCTHVNSMARGCQHERVGSTTPKHKQYEIHGRVGEWICTRLLSPCVLRARQTIKGEQKKQKTKCYRDESRLLST